MGFEEEILAVSTAWDKALVANDAEAVASFMSDGWVFVGPTGITPKADIVGWIASGRLAHHTMRMVGPARVAVHGDTAILTASKSSTGSWDGIEYAADEWMSEVYVLDGRRWLCVLSHKCPIEV